MTPPLNKSMAGNFIGIDLGGTKIRGIKAANDGKALGEKYAPTSRKGRNAVLSQLFQVVDHLKDKNTRAVGICLPGQIDAEKGLVINLPNLKGWNNFPVAETLQKNTGLPIFIDNDARCFLVAESRLGAAKNFPNAVGLTLGTGVGGALLMGGKIYCGKDCIAGELGHMVIDPSGPSCYCGSRGCLEQFASGKAIEKSMLEALRNNPANSILRGKDFSALDVFSAAKNRDHLAAKVVEKAGSYLGIGISNIINALNPEIIVIGGSVGKSLPQLLPFIQKEVSYRALVPGRKTKIVRAKLENAGAFGAAMMAIHSKR